MDRPEDITGDPLVHDVCVHRSGPPWGLLARAECSCGWRGCWHAYRTDADVEAASHQARPEGVDR
jgi:hypothetical protein